MGLDPDGPLTDEDLRMPDENKRLVDEAWDEDEKEATVEKLQDLHGAVDDLREKLGVSPSSGPVDLPHGTFEDPRFDMLLKQWVEFVAVQNDRFTVLAQKLDAMAELGVESVREDHRLREQRRKEQLRDSMAYEIYKKLVINMVRNKLRLHPDDDIFKERYAVIAKISWTVAMTFIESDPVMPVDPNFATGVNEE